jgi:hypothetical protein
MFWQNEPTAVPSSRDLAERTHRHSGTSKDLAERTHLQVLEIAVDTEIELVVAWIDPVNESQISILVSIISHLRFR